VEHDDRSAVATFVGAAPLASGGVATLGEGPAHHARVKRLALGDAVRVTDGAGRVGGGVVRMMRQSSLEIALDRVVEVPRQPAIHLRVPSGDRDRMLWLAEKVAELGVSSWQVVRFRRSASVSPRGEGLHFAEKVRARMIGALEQSGGAWLPELLPDARLDDIAYGGGDGVSDLRILLDAGGEPLASLVGLDAPRTPVILFGPEGGVEAPEREMLVAAGWRAARLAATTLRFETAGIAAVAVVRAAQMLRET
jgi:16S rRNA (uracil1498-N3)-methyltransferase